MKFIDTHSHFNLGQFDADRAEAIARMEAHGVGTICVGIDAETSSLAVELATNHKSVWACVGQHPMGWGKEFSLLTFNPLITHERVVAIGECGLDYYREEDRNEKEKQKALFEMQIELAGKHGLPLMLHLRPQLGSMDAYIDGISILKKWKQTYPSLIGTAHFFVGNEIVANQFLALGFYISFSGVITITSEYEKIVTAIPLNRILSETDAPFAAPNPYRGKRCEPWYVEEVVKKIALLKNEEISIVEQQLKENAKILFKLG